jgi:hypothetical protein
MKWVLLWHEFWLFINRTVEITSAVRYYIYMYIYIYIRAFFDCHLHLSDRFPELSADDSLSFLDNIALYG